MLFILIFFLFFLSFCFGDPVWFWLWEGLTAGTPSCFLPVENLNFHSKVSVRVLLLQTLQRHCFFVIYTPNYILQHSCSSERVAPI